MPALDSATVLVARYLQANHYNETLDAFLVEAGLPPDAGLIRPGDLTIEKILDEKRVFDMSVQFEKVRLDKDTDKPWKVPVPAVPTITSSISLPPNFLHVSIEVIDRFNGASNLTTYYLLATTADRCLHVLRATKGYAREHIFTHLHDSPILACAVIKSRYLVSSSMSGELQLTDLRDVHVIATRRDHSKYVVKIAVWEASEGAWIASAGWDNKVFIYWTSLSDNAPSLDAPTSVITLPSNPETVLFIPDPNEREIDSTPFLLVSRRDSTKLYYYKPLPTHAPPPSEPTELLLLGTQNLSPQSNAWLAFSPSSIALSPQNPSILAIATSSTPTQKLLFVRILPPTSPPPVTTPLTRAQQTALENRREDAETAAILSHTSTGATQTNWSTPQVCWRPDGSGVWVNGDDGVVRGVELRSGRVVEYLRGGHEPGAKVRGIWGGWVDGWEWVVSGGFDKRLVVWKCEEDVG